MDSKEVISAVITILQAYRDDIANNLLMRDGIKEDIIYRVDKKIGEYSRNAITAIEALKVVTEERDYDKFYH